MYFSGSGGFRLKILFFKISWNTMILFRYYYKSGPGKVDRHSITENLRQAKERKLWGKEQKHYIYLSLFHRSCNFHIILWRQTKLLLPQDRNWQIKIFLKKIVTWFDSTDASASSHRAEGYPPLLVKWTLCDKYVQPNVLLPASHYQKDADELQWSPRRALVMIKWLEGLGKLTKITKDDPHGVKQLYDWRTARKCSIDVWRMWTWEKEGKGWIVVLRQTW